MTTEERMKNIEMNLNGAWYAYNPAHETVEWLLQRLKETREALKFAYEIFSEYPEPNFDESEALDKAKRILEG